jgi:hypothetical protein
MQVRRVASHPIERGDLTRHTAIIPTAAKNRLANCCVSRGEKSVGELLCLTML